MPPPTVFVPVLFVHETHVHYKHLRPIFLVSGITTEWCFSVDVLAPSQLSLPTLLLFALPRCKSNERKTPTELNKLPALPSTRKCQQTNVLLHVCLTYTEQGTTHSSGKHREVHRKGRYDSTPTDLALESTTPPERSRVLTTTATPDRHTITQDTPSHTTDTPTRTRPLARLELTARPARPGRRPPRHTHAQSHSMASYTHIL